MSNPLVAIVMGSDSDLATMQHTCDTLKEFGIAHEVRVTSAHRTPQATHDYITDAEARGVQVFIAAAGLAAHLAGVTASLTTKPVIGVPLRAEDGPNGLDALLSTVQMPGGIPVATVAIGKAGAKNAAILATQILALSHPELAQQLKQHRVDMAAAVAAKNDGIKN